MMTRFDVYDRNEATTVGGAFVDALRARAALNAQSIPTHHWTEKIVDWWSWCAAERAVVDAHPPSRRVSDAEIHDAIRGLARRYDRRFGECLVDLAHHDFLTYDRYGEREYWRDAYGPSASPEMLLALESESGKFTNRGANRHMIFEDASKLIPLASRVKVVIFASHGEADRREILRVADLMVRHDYTRTRAGALPTWLWIDVPWSAWSEAFRPECHVAVAAQGFDPPVPAT